MIPAPTYPYIPPTQYVTAPVADEDGGVYHPMCAPLALYWLAKGQRLPKGWHRYKQTGRVRPACAGCGRRV